MGSAITSLVLHYGKHGDPLSMWMEEDGLVSKADIPTQEVKETLFFDFSKPKVSAKVVMLCEHLKDIFAELDMSSDILEVAVNNEKKSLSFSTFGSAQRESFIPKGHENWTPYFPIPIYLFCLLYF